MDGLVIAETQLQGYALQNYPSMDAAISDSLFVFVFFWLHNQELQFRRLKSLVIDYSSFKLTY